MKTSVDKVIFLDIDGVLNSERIFDERSWLDTLLDPYCVKLIEDLAKECDITLVLSSSWRQQGFEHCKEAFMSKGFPNFFDLFHEDWRTPKIYSRGKEVKDWVEFHNVKKYLCIDDDSGDFFSYQPLLQTSPITGLTLSDSLFVKKFFGFEVDDGFLTSSYEQLVKITEKKLKMLEDL